MQYIQRFDLKRGEYGKARKWLVENAQALADNAPAGWSYLGTWMTCRGFGKYGCETRWEIDDYDVLGPQYIGNEAFQKLMLEYIDYIDDAKIGETCLMKSAGDIAIMDGI